MSGEQEEEKDSSTVKTSDGTQIPIPSLGNQDNEYPPLVQFMRESGGRVIAIDGKPHIDGVQKN